MTDVRRLLGEATPLPWFSETADNIAPAHVGALGHLRGVGDYAIGYFRWDGPRPEDQGDSNADAELVALAVNRLPDYEAAVDALEALADAATALENRSIRSSGEFHVWVEERMVTEARDAARAALRRLRDEVPA